MSFAACSTLSAIISLPAPIGLACAVRPWYRSGASAVKPGVAETVGDVDDVRHEPPPLLDHDHAQDRPPLGQDSRRTSPRCSETVHHLTHGRVTVDACGEAARHDPAMAASEAARRRTRWRASAASVSSNGRSKAILGGWPVCSTSVARSTPQGAGAGRRHPATSRGRLGLPGTATAPRRARDTARDRSPRRVSVVESTERVRSRTGGGVGRSLRLVSLPARWAAVGLRRRRRRAAVVAVGRLRRLDGFAGWRRRSTPAGGVRPDCGGSTSQWVIGASQPEGCWQCRSRTWIARRSMPRKVRCLDAAMTWSAPSKMNVCTWQRLRWGTIRSGVMTVPEASSQTESMVASPARMQINGSGRRPSAGAVWLASTASSTRAAASRSLVVRTTPARWFAVVQLAFDTAQRFADGGTADGVEREVSRDMVPSKPVLMRSEPGFSRSVRSRSKASASSSGAGTRSPWSPDRRSAPHTGRRGRPHHRE